MQPRSRFILLLLLVAFAFTAVACGSEDEPLSINPVEAETDLHTNIEHNFRGFADAVAFLATSEVTCDTLNAIPFPGSDVSAPSPTDPIDPNPLPPEETGLDCGSDLDARVIADDIVEFLTTRVFVEANVEATTSSSVVYRLLPAVVCDGSDDCSEMLNIVEPRLRVRSYDKGNFDVDILIGDSQKKVATVELYQRSVAVEGDLGAAWSAFTAIMRAEEPDFALPGTVSGVVRLDMVENAALDYTLDLSITKAIAVAVGPFEDGGDLIEVSVAKAPTLSSIHINGNTESLTASFDANAIDLTVPGNIFGSSASGGCSIDEFGNEICVDGEDSSIPGSLSVHAAGLNGTIAVEAGVDKIELTGLGLGDGSSTVAIDGVQVLSIDLNAEIGRTLDATLTEDDGRLRIEVRPALSLFIDVSFAAVANLFDDIDPWMLSERLGVVLSGTNPTLLMGDEMEVAVGKLELISQAANVTVDAGQCLVEADVDSSHPFLNVTAGPCGQNIDVPTPGTPTPDPVP